MAPSATPSRPTDDDHREQDLLADAEPATAGGVAGTFTLPRSPDRRTADATCMRGQAARSAGGASARQPPDRAAQHDEEPQVRVVEKREERAVDEARDDRAGHRVRVAAKGEGISARPAPSARPAAPVATCRRSLECAHEKKEHHDRARRSRARPAAPRTTSAAMMLPPRSRPYFSSWSADWYAPTIQRKLPPPTPKIGFARHMRMPIDQISRRMSAVPSSVLLMRPDLIPVARADERQHDDHDQPR